MGISAKYMAAKYPDGTMIDIGSNIGDTAAMMATYAPNKLLLIESSDYYHSILVRNVQKLPNETEVRQVFVSDGSKVSGHFHHWGGTAFFRESDKQGVEIKTERLCDLADKSTCFIKVDTDGYDFKILTDSLEWLASVHPAVLFESQIQNEDDLASANELYTRLIQA